jgi:L,D-transpeptidase catalytic domain
MGGLHGVHGWLGLTRRRVVLVLGIVCVSTLVVAAPAMADDQTGGGSPNAGNSADSAHDSAPATYASTPCTQAARACVDLAKQRAWLIDTRGNVTRGPVPISSGGPGEETPTGTFSVQWKDKNHTSQEFKDPKGNPAAMPYSVFFADGGVAFHGGSVRRASAGCVHLNDADAQVFYDTLQLGDEVQVH